MKIRWALGPARSLKLSCLACLALGLACLAMRLCAVSMGNAVAAESRATEAAEKPTGRFTDKDVQRQTRAYFEPVFNRDLPELHRAIERSHHECLLACGRGHPEEQVWLYSLRIIQDVRRLPPDRQKMYLMANQAWYHAATGVNDFKGEAMPDPSRAADVFASLRSVRDSFCEIAPHDRGMAHCDMWLIVECALVRDWRTALNRVDQYMTDWQPKLGQDTEAIQHVTLLETLLLSELSEDTPRQIRLAEAYISFVDRYRLEGLYVFWRERGMTVLAEIQFRAGNRREADRLYAEVRSRLPENSDHSLAGWCKSWCDRHQARRLLEKGDYEGAEEKISSARLGTIRYSYRNLNTGLTMERILRMSAEIRRKLGRDKEADEDLAYAQRIVDNVAKLKAALQADLEKPHRPTESTPLSPTDSLHRNPQTTQ